MATSASHSDRWRTAPNAILEAFASPCAPSAGSVLNRVPFENVCSTARPTGATVGAMAANNGARGLCSGIRNTERCTRPATVVGTPVTTRLPPIYETLIPRATRRNKKPGARSPSRLWRDTPAAHGYAGGARRSARRCRRRINQGRLARRYDAAASRLGCLRRSSPNGRTSVDGVCPTWNAVSIERPTRRLHVSLHMRSIWATRNVSHCSQPPKRRARKPRRWRTRSPRSRVRMQRPQPMRQTRRRIRP